MASSMRWPRRSHGMPVMVVVLGPGADADAEGEPVAA